MHSTILPFLLMALGTCDECQDFVKDFPEFSPIRIDLHYVGAFDSPVLRDTILPAVARFFESTVMVRRQTGLTTRYNQQLSPDGSGPVETRCNGVRLPDVLLNGVTGDGWSIPSGRGTDADLDVLVSVQSDMGSALADAVSCANDVCGRPSLGAVRINENMLESGDWTETAIDHLIEALVHEFIHILVFDTHLFRLFRDPATMALRDADQKSVDYRCVQQEGVDRFKIEWNVDPTLAGPDIHTYYFAPKVLAALEVRGMKRSKCRCPMEPNLRYTSEDIEDCLHHANNCAIAIVTPGVAAAMQQYYACPSARGMEIENAFGIACSKLTASHWKTRLLNHELMTPVKSPGSGQFISEMTVALLEDSGWYRTNRAKMVTPILHAKFFWGHQAGCPFLTEMCIDSRGAVLAPATKTFCNSRSETSCSLDRLNMVLCDSIFDTAPQDKTQLTQYRYAGRVYAAGLTRFDQCPVFEQIPGGECMGDSRCHEMSFTPTGRATGCLRSICSQSRTSYRVIVDGMFAEEECRSSSQTVRAVLNKEMVNLECGDPKIICQAWKYPHLLHSSTRPVPGFSGDSLEEIREYSKQAASPTGKLTVLLMTAVVAYF